MASGSSFLLVNKPITRKRNSVFLRDVVIEREKKEGKNGYQPLLERRMLLGNSILIPVTITSILIIVKLLLKKNVETVQ